MKKQPIKEVAEYVLKMWPKEDLELEHCGWRELGECARELAHAVLETHRMSKQLQTTFRRACELLDECYAQGQPFILTTSLGQFLEEHYYAKTIAGELKRCACGHPTPATGGDVCGLCADSSRNRCHRSRRS